MHCIVQMSKYNFLKRMGRAIFGNIPRRSLSNRKIFMGFSPMTRNEIVWIRRGWFYVWNLHCFEHTFKTFFLKCHDIQTFEVSHWLFCSLALLQNGSFSSHRIKVDTIDSYAILYCRYNKEVSKTSHSISLRHSTSDGVFTQLNCYKRALQ
jgi:hypothetical protein